MNEELIFRFDVDGNDFATSGKFNETEDIQLGAVYTLENYSLTYIYNADISNFIFVNVC